MIKKRETTSGLSKAIQLSFEQHIENTTYIKMIPPEFSIKIANTLEEREAVFALAYQVYLEKGYVKENLQHWLVKNYDFFSQTVILIVQNQCKQIVGSLTLVFNEDSKLPVEKIYQEEINFVKLGGNKILEVSRLIISNEYRNTKEVLNLLLNYMLIYSYHVKKYHSMVIQVNPRHKLYYKSLLKYDEIGEEKECPSAQNAPAVLLHLPLSRYQEEIKNKTNLTEQNKKNRSLYNHFLNVEQEKLVAHYLADQFKPMTSEEKIYFGYSESGLTKILCV